MNVDLCVGKVGGEYGNDVPSVGYRVCNGLVGIPCVPSPGSEGG